MIHSNHRTISLLTGLLSFVIGLHLMAPGIYWGESALLTARAWQLGGSHPPGYQGFLHIIHMFQRSCVVGDIAFRSNILGLLIAASSAALMCLLFLKWKVQTPIAVVSTLAFFGCLPVVNATAFIEVYAFHILLFLAIITIASNPEVVPRDILLLSFISAIALTHHLTFVLFIPGLFTWTVLNRKRFQALSSIVSGILFFLLGLSIYLYLPIREHCDPSIVWGQADSMKGFLNLITASEEARGAFLSGVSSWSQILSRLNIVSSLMISTFTLPGLLFAIAGCGAVFFRNPSFGIFSIISFMSLSVSVVLYDSNETASFYLPALLLVWFWAICGLTVLINCSTIRSWSVPKNLKRLLTILPVIFMITTLKKSWNQCPRDVHVPATVGRASIDHFSDDGVMVSRRSDWSFIHWYLNDVEKRSRQNMIFQHLLSFSWYYDDILPTGLIAPGLDPEIFEDTFQWNSAITASLVAQTLLNYDVLLADSEVIVDMQSAGWKAPEMSCSLFGIQTRSVLINPLNEDVYLFVPGRLDPVSTQALGALWFRYSKCCENSAMLKDSKSSLVMASYYHHLGVRQGWWE